MDSKPVLSDHQSQAAAVVPSDLELAVVVNVVQGPHSAGWNGARAVPHFSEPDAAALWVLLPQEIQPCLIYFHKLIPSIVMVCL